MNTKIFRQTKRKTRVRVKIKGTKERPRLSVFRSSRHIYAQLIDDVAGKTILGVSEAQLGKDLAKAPKAARAKELGVLLVKMAKEKKIKQVVFDRGGYRYHGRVKAFSDGAREGGLEF